MADLNESNDEGLAGMSGMTSYNKVEGEFFLHQMPTPDEQVVKQTIQGVVDEFIYKTDQVSLQSILKQNDSVNITEKVFLGEATSISNKSKTSYSTDSGGNPFNRMVIQAGIGSYNSNVAATLSSSVYDEIIAIAVDDVKPFMIKGLDTDHEAVLVDDKPTNDGYIKHLTPTKESFIASIESPSILTSAGGPSRILVHYNAIDLTGQVVAGVSLTPTQVNVNQRPYHVEGEHKGYLIVEKMIPASTTLYEVSTGVFRSLSDILLKPYSSPPGTSSDVQLSITAPGGIISLPSKEFKRPIKSHLLKTHGFGGSFPSPFIDISDCLLTRKDSLLGYGYPKAVLNPNTPDETANPSHHVMTVKSNVGSDLSSYDGVTNTPSQLTRSTLQVFNVIDNMVKQNQHLLLVSPANKNRYAVFDDFLTESESRNPSLVSIEIALLRGRAEEFNTTIKNGNASLEIRGRSKLMDITDKETSRNLNLGESIPIKEIGDVGTPTVSLTLGGVGQGGADQKPEWVEHRFLEGWKDRLVSSGNVSVRNDRQTSTDYASTRALVELPLFPSMFYDVDGIYKETNGIDDSIHPIGNEVLLTLDCTMTAKNRVQMRDYEARHSIDWGMQDSKAAIEFDNSIAFEATANNLSFGLKAQMPSIQAVITGHALTLGTANSYIQVDDTEPFFNDTLQNSNGPEINPSTGVLGKKFYITVGEGFVAPTGKEDLGYCTYHMMRVHKIDNATNRIYVDESFLRYPQRDEALNLTAVAPTATSKVFLGATVTLGGVIVNDITGHTQSIKLDYSSSSAGMADLFKAQIDALLGVNSSHTFNLSGLKDFLIIPDHIGFGGLEWDIFNEYGSNNNRELREPVICHQNFTGLKGINADGDDLKYVIPNIYSLRNIALKSNGFSECVNELIRQINMGGHPQAKNDSGSSAYDTPLEGSSRNTGGHMGYVRSFIGSEVVSRNGESGLSIVIHSTVPGATGREFAVWISNRSVYPYQPIQAIGHGGLLATNSKSYQLNSFPAPMPLGADGEAFVPITTFTGAPHGAISHYNDSDANLREYNGVGSIFKAKTKSTATGLSSSNGSYNWDNGAKRFIYMTVEGKVMDYFLRTLQSRQTIGTGSALGLVRINNKLATFSNIAINQGSESALGECYLEYVTPLEDPDKFVKFFYEGAFNTPADEEVGQEIEFLYPLMDSEGILFFGGGHTGLTFDISDGTDNDYSDFYKHALSKGPTGFSGFQNIGEMTAPVAILDFTDVKNEDTINNDTLKGFHHQTVLNQNNEPEGKCAFYARLTNSLYDSTEDVGTGALTQANTLWREDLYNRKLRITSANGFGAYIDGPTHPHEVMQHPTNNAQVKLFHHGDVVALFNNNSGTIEAEHGEIKDFNPLGASWAVSAIFRPPTSNPDYATGPIFHSIYDDGTPNGKPYGLHIGGSPSVAHGGTTKNAISVAISFPEQLYPHPNNSPLATSVLVPSTVSGGTVEVVSSAHTFIMAGRDPGGATPAFLYMGNTVGITNPLTGAIEAGIFDYSPYLVSVSDQNYGTLGVSPNKKNTFETQASGYSGGDADHPDVPTALQTIRDKDMTTIGCALIGAPYVKLLAGWTTQGGQTITAPHQDYFTALQTGAATYGVTGTGGSFGDGKNSAGPIHFAGFLSDVALWKRGMSYADATSWYASRIKW